jgi:hypothetical protein
MTLPLEHFNYDTFRVLLEADGPKAASTSRL